MAQDILTSAVQGLSKYLAFPADHVTFEHSGGTPLKHTLTEPKMRITYVAGLQPFQRLIVTICSILRLQGCDSDDVTVDRVSRISSTVPAVRKMMVRLGWEFSWPEDERVRITNIVKENMQFFEQRIYVFGEFMEIENAQKAQKTNPVVERA